MKRVRKDNGVKIMKAQILFPLLVGVSIFLFPFSAAAIEGAKVEEEQIRSSPEECETGFMCVCATRSSWQGTAVETASVGQLVDVATFLVPQYTLVPRGSAIGSSDMHEYTLLKDLGGMGENEIGTEKCGLKQYTRNATSKASVLWKSGVQLSPSRDICVTAAEAQDTPVSCGGSSFQTVTPSLIQN